jgi:hypothetical protein
MFTRDRKTENIRHNLCSLFYFILPLQYFLYTVYAYEEIEIDRCEILGSHGGEDDVALACDAVRR